MTNFTIKVVSDPVCPFCYLGKKRLEKAISVYQQTYPGGNDDTFTITWHPFYLDPSAPKVGVPLIERMTQRFGASRLEAMHSRLRQMGKVEGLNFTFGGKVGNTRDAHRLVQLGKTKSNDTENRIISEMMKSYFEEDGDITSWDTLIEAGVKAGLDRDETRVWLEEGSGGEQVDIEVAQAYRQGIQGVPHFEIQERWTVDGAEEAQYFLDQIVAAKEA